MRRKSIVFTIIKTLIIALVFIIDCFTWIGFDYKDYWNNHWRVGG